MSDAAALLLIFVVSLAVIMVIAALTHQRPPTMEERMSAMTRQMADLSFALRTALLPAVREAVSALEAFGKAVGEIGEGAEQ